MRRARGNKKAGDFVSSEILDHYDYQESSAHGKPADPNLPPNAQLKPAENNDIKDENESRTSDSKMNQEAIFEINNSARKQSVSESKPVLKSKRDESDDLDPHVQHSDEYPHIDMKIHLEKLDKNDSKPKRTKKVSQQDSVEAPPKEVSETKVVDPAPEKVASPAKVLPSPPPVQKLAPKLDAEPEHFSEGEEANSLNHKLLGFQKKSEYILSMIGGCLNIYHTVSVSEKISIIRDLYSIMPQNERRAFE